MSTGENLTECNCVSVSVFSLWRATDTDLSRGFWVLLAHESIYFNLIIHGKRVYQLLYTVKGLILSVSCDSHTEVLVVT